MSFWDEIAGDQMHYDRQKKEARVLRLKIRILLRLVKVSDLKREDWFDLGYDSYRFGESLPPRSELIGDISDDVVDAIAEIVEDRND
jgi:hypothetical protein